MREDARDRPGYTVFNTVFNTDRGILRPLWLPPTLPTERMGDPYLTSPSS